MLNLQLNNGILPTIMALILLIIITEVADAQRRSHTMGRFEYAIDAQDMYNTSSQPEFSFTGTWPQDYYRYGTIAFHWNGHLFGRYTNADGQEILRYDEVWPSNAGFRLPPEYGLNEFRRLRSPVTLLEKADGAIAEVTRRFDGVVDPDLPSDMMIELKYKSPPGIETTKRSYSFANQYHSDYIIQHNQYIVTFDADEDPGVDLGIDPTQVLEDVYFVIAYSFTNVAGTNMNQTRWYSEARGEFSTFEVINSQLVPGKSMTVAYGYDAQHPDILTFESDGKPFDNIGNPRYAIGIMPGTTYMPTAELTSSTYSGYTILHVDESPHNRQNKVNQPVSILTNANINNVWDRRFDGHATWWDWAGSGVKERAEDVPGWPTDPGQRPGSMIFKSFGPYNLVMGDTVNIVFAVGAGGISREIAEEKGKEWLAWYRNEPGATFDDAAKNELVASGRDSLMNTLDKAAWAWENGLNVSNPLPSPDLIITEGANRISLSWTDLNSRYPDVDHYRVWRKRGSFLHDTDEELESIIRQRSDGKLWPDGERRKWEVIATVPSSQITYEDTEVVRGEPYYYGVTVVSTGANNTGLVPGPLESSPYTNRSQQPAFSFQPGEGSTSNIRIVPNPFVASAGDFNFSDETNKLLFVNLPPYAKLRIFNAMGDLVKIIDHSNGSADEAWDQVTDYNQLASSGVYILHVSDARDADQNSLPDAISKFVIVR
jgi:hypothetical protein